jgi:hypothetical protein
VGGENDGRNWFVVHLRSDVAKNTFGRSESLWQVVCLFFEIDRNQVPRYVAAQNCARLRALFP